MHEPIVVYAADLKSKLLINFKKIRQIQKKYIILGKT